MARRERPPVIPLSGEIPIGLVVRAMRWGRGLELRELADSLGYSASHISHVETGSQLPSPAMVQDIAAYFDLSADELRAVPRERLKEFVSIGLRTRARQRTRAPRTGGRAPGDVAGATARSFDDELGFPVAPHPAKTEQSIHSERAHLTSQFATVLDKAENDPVKWRTTRDLLESYFDWLNSHLSKMNLP